MKSQNYYLWKFIKGSFGKHIWLWLVVLVLGLIILLAPSPFAKAQSPLMVPPADGETVYLLKLEDEIISPITADYIRHGLEQAQSHGAKALIIQMDTPGGLLASTHTIVKDILNAPLPVVVYVAPSGARAGSAGVFITMASHVAVMAPYTRIGAAHPVDENGNWPPTNLQNPGLQKSSDDIMNQKIMNDTIAGIRAVTQARGRNTAWAVKAVTDSASITAEEALKAHVIDFIAPDLESLIQGLDGRTVMFNSTNRTTLHLNHPQIITLPFSRQQRFLSILTHPMLAYLLLMIGFYGLLFEITHPGIGASGTVGAVCVLLALIGMQAMSINIAGLGLIFMGLVLFIAEVFTPRFGGLFAGGLVCLILGTLLLYQTDEPMMRQLIPYMVSISLVLGSLTGVLLWKIIKTHGTKAKGPFEKLIGQIGIVAIPIAPGQPGKIKVYGEIWDAESEEILPVGTNIQVIAINPLDKTMLKVIEFVREF